MAYGFPLNKSKPWSERIKHFGWVWHAVIMGTGILSTLCDLFPYGGTTLALQWLGFAFLIINLILFVFVCTCTVARYIMFPEVWELMLNHPAQSLFMGCFPMGMATLINGSLNLNRNWGWGGTTFLYVLWGFWWLDSLLSFVIAFGMLYVMIVRHEHSMSKMTAVWLLPVVTLIVASSTGGLLTRSLLLHSTRIALITTAVSFIMVTIGLSFALMMITIYFCRLVTYGTPDAGMILSAFVALGPLGQGGFSLLINGQNFSHIFPLYMNNQFPFVNQGGDMVFAGAFVGSYILWSMGVAWIILALASIFSIVRKTRVPFSMAYWGMVFPNGTFALLSDQLGTVLDSPFFRVVGAIWSIVVLVLWIWIFSRSIPGFIDGSLFKAPYVPEGIPVQLAAPQTSDIEKGTSQWTGFAGGSQTAVVDHCCRILSSAGQV